MSTKNIYRIYFFFFFLNKVQIFFNHLCKIDFCLKLDVISDFFRNKCEQFLKCIKNMQAKNLHYMITL